MDQVELRTGDDILEKVEVESAASTAPRPSDADDKLLRLADELCTWLRALESFFRWHNHPRSQDRKSSYLTRDWKAETSVAHDALVRVRHLTLSLHTIAQGDPPLDELGLNEDEDDSVRRGLEINNALLADVDELVGDACNVCEGLLAASTVEFKSWFGFGRMLERELRRIEVIPELERLLREHESHDLHAALARLAATVTPAPLGADIVHIFQDLTRLLAALRFITPLLAADLPLKQTLPLLTLIHDDAKDLIAFIEKRALRTEEIEGTIFDTLDGIAYALGMELRKVFAFELSDIAAARQAAHIYSRIETAHGLLRDAFQQSIITLAQALDPALKDSDLFDVIRTKLEQSLALRADIWLLMNVLRGYERNPTAPHLSLADLLERCRAFRTGSMQFLMYKDWEAYELFVEELTRARSIPEALPVLHRFATYLDTLFGQINMRAVLKDHPFEPQPAAIPFV